MYFLSRLEPIVKMALARNVNKLIGDLVGNGLNSPGSGDCVDGILEPLPPPAGFGSPLPSPLIGTAWERHDNTTSLFAEKPTRRMKTLQWTKLYPDLSGERLFEPVYESSLFLSSQFVTT